MLDGLARMEVALRSLGHPGFQVSVWDDDTVSPTNLLRQRFLSGDEGRNKAEVVVERYNLFFGTQWRAHNHRYDSNAIRFSDRLLLITCVDSASTRIAIADHIANVNREGGLWLDTGNDSHRGQVILGHIGTPKTGILRLPHVLDLYPEMREQATALDDDAPSCSAEEALTSQDWPINRQVATSACTLLWNLLRHGSLDYHGLFVDSRTGATTPLPIDRAGWAFMGYTAPAARNAKGQFAATG